MKLVPFPGGGQTIARKVSTLGAPWILLTAPRCIQLSNLIVGKGLYTDWTNNIDVKSKGPYSTGSGDGGWGWGLFVRIICMLVSLKGQMLLGSY